MTRQGFARCTRKLRSIVSPVFGLTLCGFALTLVGVAGTPSPAVAFGGMGFGHMGGFGGMGMGRSMGPSMRTPMMTPRRGTGTYIARPPSGTKGNAGNGDGNRWPPRHPVIGHPIIVPIPGGGTPPAANIPPTPPTGTAGLNGGGGGGGGGGGAAGGTGGGMPPRGERRFVPDEVITAFAASTTPQAIEQLARRHNLTQLETINLPLLGTTIYRWRINGRRPVGDLVGAIEDERIVASVQPNYLFTLQEDAAKVPGTGQSYAEQYVLGKLGVEQAHRVAIGKNVAIALIDSEVDVKNPNLDGVIVKNFDALGGDDKPHQHGTAMAGAIAAHGKIVGIAPGAQLLAARAFDEDHDSKAKSSAIYKSLQWAADNGARVVNMSFAGPADPTLHRLLAAAADKGVVLIAAAGNAGPGSPPLYPARSQRDRGDGHRFRRCNIHDGQPRKLYRGGRARRRHSCARTRRSAAAHDRHVGRHRPRQRARGALTRMQALAQAGGHTRHARRHGQAARLRRQAGECLSRGDVAQCGSIGHDGSAEAKQ